MEPRKMVQMNGLHGRNRDTYAENKRMDTKGGKWQGGGGGRMNYEVGIDTHRLIFIK